MMSTYDVLSELTESITQKNRNETERKNWIEGYSKRLENMQITTSSSFMKMEISELASCKQKRDAT